jgi:hypothetical protein
MAMELTGQISALEDDVNILKGEVKSILEEIRTALLDRDNPFSPQVQANLESVKALVAEREAVLASAVPSGLPVFQPVQRPGSTEEPAEPGQQASTGPTPPPAGPTPPPPTAAGPTTPPGPVPGPATGDQMNNALPQAPPAAGPPAPNSSPQVAPPRAEAATPQPAAANPESSGGPAPAPPIAEEVGPEPWSVSTIASLVAWIDETTSRLGPTHLHITLDLARFGGLLPPEAEDVLLKVIKLASGRKDSTSPSVNDILLALRQLEAILQGEDADELTLVRRRRSAGRSR